MVQITSYLLLFTAVFFTFNHELGLSIRIETSPKTFNDLTTKEIRITCTADGSAYWAKSISTIEMGKAGQPPIAVFKSSNGMMKGPGARRNIQAEGHIENDARKSYLRLSVKNPRKEDAGTYTCLIYYLNESYKMKEESVDVNITMDTYDNAQLVKDLFKKVSFLKNMIYRQQNYTKEQSDKIENLERKVTQITRKENKMSSFLAGNTFTGSLTRGEVLKFGRVEENIGNNYDPLTGFYTAPFDGLYAFHLFALSTHPTNDKSRREVQIQLIANNKVRVILLDDHMDFYDQSSVSCAVTLKAGDIVQCVVSYLSHNDNKLQVYPWTGFSGYLIQPFE